VLALTHPEEIVSSVAVSPDGKTIAAAGLFLIRLWDVQTKKEKWTLHGHTKRLSGVAFTADSRWLLSGSLDGTIKVWDTTTGSLVRTLHGHTLGVTGVALLSDGRRLASSGLDGTIRVWEWDRDQEALTVEEPLGPVVSLAFHPDGRHLASGSVGVSLWDIPTGKVSRSFKEWFLNAGASAVAFSPDGKRLATLGLAVKVWDTASGKKLFGNDLSFLGEDKKANDNEDVGGWGLAFSPDGKHIASFSTSLKEVKILIWDSATGKKIRSMGREAGMRRKLDTGISIAYSPDGKYVASGGLGEVVTLWDAVSGDAVHTFPEFPDAVRKVSFTRDGRRLLAASDSSVRVWELPSGQEVFRFRLTSTRTPTGPGTAGTASSFTADGQRLATAAGDGTVKVWDVTSGQQILSLSSPGSKVSCVAFSPDGRWLAAGGAGGAKGILRVWDARLVEEKNP
jgi:WD40 repeat protein